MPGDVAMHPSLEVLHRVHLKRTAELFGDAAQRPEPDEARRVFAPAPQCLHGQRPLDTAAPQLASSAALRVCYSPHRGRQAAATAASP